MPVAGHDEKSALNGAAAAAGVAESACVRRLPEVETVGKRHLQVRSGLKALASVTAIALAVLGIGVPAARANHGNQRLEVSPETDSNPQGSQHVLTATLYQGDTMTTGGATGATGPVVVDFAVEAGPNSGETYACTIVVGSSRCSVSYTGDEGVGTDRIRAVIRGHEPDLSEGRYAGPTDCPTPPDPNEPGSPSPASEGGCQSGTPQPGGTTETQGDATDVVEKQWTQALAGEVCIDVEPNTRVNPSGSSHEIRLLVTNGRKVNDVAGRFDCSGTPRFGVLVDLSLTDDDPNAYFETVEGQPTGASGGGPNSVSCSTDSAGTCRATIRTVAPSAEGTNSVSGAVRGDAPDDVITVDNQETVTKEWRRSGGLAAVRAEPRADTNERGTRHVVTVTASDEFGNPVSGAAISFQVTEGIHSDNDLDSNANTPAGYFGQCTTTADGTCSQSYLGTEIGDDTITVFEDDDSDFRYDLVGDEPVDEVTKTWVEAGQGTRRVRIDMETDPDSDALDENGPCDGDRQPPIQESGWNQRANDNPVDRRASHKVCAERFGPNDAPQAGPVTFTIVSGPGHFTGSQGTADFGREYIAGEDADGYNVAYVSSTETGETVVRASVDDVSDSGVKPWVAPPSSARTIDLEPESGTNEPATEHEVTAVVYDGFGNPVEGVTVTFAEDGAGRFVDGGAQVVRTTNADGEARARTTTGRNETGTQTITASLSASSTECDEPANSPEQGDPEGVCSDTVTKTWEEEDEQPPPVEDECDEPNVMCGTEDDDVITGTEGDDIIVAYGGDDTVDGRGGDDIIRLGSGEDVAVGGDGDDHIIGASGRDTIDGEEGADVVTGGSDRDSLSGGARNDTLRGGTEADVLRGNQGWDNLRGGDDRDTLRGGYGRDTLRGGRHNDVLRGYRGPDVLYGGSGNDLLDGGPQRDRCRPGSGRDRMRNC